MKTDRNQGMKESDVEGEANHNGPELCGGDGNVTAEALAGESAGVVLSPEIRSSVSGADRLFVLGRQHADKRSSESVSGPAGSETHRMHRRYLYGNREILQPALRDCSRVRTANSKEARLW